MFQVPPSSNSAQRTRRGIVVFRGEADWPHMGRQFHGVQEFQQCYVVIFGRCKLARNVVWMYEVISDLVLARRMCPVTVGAQQRMCQKIMGEKKGGEMFYSGILYAIDKRTEIYLVDNNQWASYLASIYTPCFNINNIYRECWALQECIGIYVLCNDKVYKYLE